MKIEILLLYLLVSRLDSVPVRDRDEDDATDERHEFGPPDHIDGLPLERDGDLNTVSEPIAPYMYVCLQRRIVRAVMQTHSIQIHSHLTFQCYES